MTPTDYQICITKVSSQIITIPAIYPRKAIHVIRFIYHINGIFSIPMATTPAADPIISIEPPTPAQKVSKCQNRPSYTNAIIYDGSAEA